MENFGSQCSPAMMLHFSGERNASQTIIGSWAGDHILIDSKKPQGYEEVIFDLQEDR